MSIVFTAQTQGNADGVSSANTASVSPSANQLVLVAVHWGFGTSTSPTLTGNSLTYVEITSVGFDSIASPGDKLSVFRAMGSSPTSGAITIDFGGSGQDAIGWSVTFVDGVNTSGTNGSGAIVQSKTGSSDSAASLTITLNSALQANSANYGAIGNGNASLATPGSGYTELHDQTWTGPDSGLETQYKVAGTTTVDWSGLGAGSQIGGIGIEIAAAAPTAVITGTATASIVEGDIVTGGKTIICTLTNDTFKKNLADLVYVGGQSNKFAGTTSAQTVNFALTGGTDAAPLAGDLVISTYVIGTAGRTPVPIIENSGGTDYTTMGSQLNSDDSFDTRMLTAYRFMPSPTETQIVFTCAGGGTGNIQDAGAYTIHVFRNVDTGTPMDVAVQTATGIDGHAAAPPSISPTTAGAWVYAAGGAAAGTGAVFTSSDMTDFRTQSQADTNDAIVGAGYSTSDTSPAVFGGGGAGTTTDSWCALTAALRPATTNGFNDNRDDFIAGFDSAQAEGTGWDAEVKAKASVTEVVRTSSTVVTWTVAAQAGYNITAQETITGTIPASILVGGAAIVATPTFTIDFT